MDVTKLLEADHRTVEELFAKIEEAEGEERQPLVDELLRSLRAHMELEERTVYPRMEPVTGGETVEEGNEEHLLARKVLEDVESHAPDQPGFMAVLAAAKAAIEHHVEEEEGEVFPKLRSEGKEILEAIAAPFLQARTELGLPVGPEALADASTKEELLEDARSAGVDGASSMNKAELAAALSDKMAATT